MISYAGVVDEKGEFTGDDIAFVYPDFVTALCGVFASGVMVSGRPAVLDSVKIVGDIAHPVFSIVSGSKEVSYCRSSRESIGLDTLVGDPYEARTVEVLLGIGRHYSVSFFGEG